MDFLDVVSTRHSIRRFEKREVEEDKLRTILECVRAAPSGGNLQAYMIVVVRQTAQKEALARAAWNQSFIAEAPLVLVFFRHPARSGGKYGQRGRELYSLQDATIAGCHAHLCATALGLASCWVGAFGEEEVSGVLRAPKGLVPIAMLPLGYAAEAPELTDRRPLDDLVCWDSF